MASPFTWLPVGPGDAAWTGEGEPGESWVVGPPAATAWTYRPIGTPPPAITFNQFITEGGVNLIAEDGTLFVAETPPPPPKGPFTPMGALAKGLNADNIAFNSPTFTGRNDYTDKDVNIFLSMGVTWLRMPIDAPYLIQGLPINGVSAPLSDAGFVARGLANFEAKMALFSAAGILVVPCLYVNKSMRAARVAAGTYSQLITQAMTIMANLWCNPALPYTPSAPYVTYTDKDGVTTSISSAYYDHTKLMINLINEPNYDNTKPGYMYTDWSNATGTGDMDAMIAAVRAVTSTHTIMCDTVRIAKAEYIKYQYPSADNNVIYSIHVYNPTNLTGSATPGFSYDPYYRYPREAVISPANPTTGYSGPFNARKQKQYTLSRYNGLTYTREYWGDEINLTDPFNTTNNPPSGLDAYIYQAVGWASGTGPFANVAGTPQNLVMGEFGCSAASDYQSRINWIRDVIAMCEKYNIPRAFWSVVGSDYGIRPSPTKDPLQHNIDTTPGSLTYGYDLDLIYLLAQ